MHLAKFNVKFKPQIIFNVKISGSTVLAISHNGCRRVNNRDGYCSVVGHLPPPTYMQNTSLLDGSVM